MDGDVRGLARRARARAGRRRRPRSAARSGTRPGGARGSRGAARIASAACSRGSAYSISSKRTSRGLAKTSKDSATRSRCEAPRPASRLRLGIACGARRADAVEQPEHVVVDHDVLQPLAPRAPRRGRRVAAVVGARQRERRVREREQLEVVVAVDVRVELVEHVVERERLVDGVEAEGGHAAQGDGGHDSERAEPDPRGAQLVAARRRSARSRRRARAPSPRRSPPRLPSLRARPVRAGDERAGERLRVDVAEVRKREPVGVQLAHEPVQADPGLGADEARSRGRHRARGRGGRATAASRRSARRRRTSGRRPRRAPRGLARRPRSARPGSLVARARRARTTARATSSTTCLPGYPRMSWEPELEELRRREELAPRDGRRGARGAPARVRAPDRARADRAAVRPGHASTRPARSRAAATYDDDGELEDFLPANMVVRPGRDRRPRARSSRATTSPSAAAPPTPRSGRRWSTPSGWRTTCGCRSCGSSTAPAAAAASSRSRRWASPTCRRCPASSWRSRNLARGAGGGGGARAGGRPRRGARGRLALLA